MKNNSQPKITVFHCINTFEDDAALEIPDAVSAKIKFIKMACASMVKDIYLLRAFEAGADAVLVAVCPEGFCRYVEGNLRAKKRIGWVRNLLDEIGLDARRLSMVHAAHDDHSAVMAGVEDLLQELETLGPNPAA